MSKQVFQFEDSTRQMTKEDIEIENSLQQINLLN